VAGATNLDGTPPKPAERPLSKWVHKYRWKFQEYDPGLAPILPAVWRFCSDALNHREQPEVMPYWLTILGPSGVGKTHILKQAYSMLYNNDHLWEVRTSQGERLPQCAHLKPLEDLKDWQAPSAYANYDLLYIEDIGAGAKIDERGHAKGTAAVTASRLTELLMSRVGRWTLLDANLLLEEVDTILDPRITSRFKRDGSILIEVPSTVPDFNYRPKQNI
jgi:hypothetical protein